MATHDPSPIAVTTRPPSTPSPLHIDPGVPAGSVLADRPNRFISADDHGASVIQAIQQRRQFVTIVHNEVQQDTPHIVTIENFCLFYGTNKALHEVSMSVPRHKVVALIGPSGCGKSTLPRSVNRRNGLMHT